MSFIKFAHLVSSSSQCLIFISITNHVPFFRASGLIQSPHMSLLKIFSMPYLTPSRRLGTYAGARAFARGEAKERGDALRSRTATRGRTRRRTQTQGNHAEHDCCNFDTFIYVDASATSVDDAAFVDHQVHSSQSIGDELIHMCCFLTGCLLLLWMLNVDRRRRSRSGARTRRKRPSKCWTSGRISSLSMRRFGRFQSIVDFNLVLARIAFHSIVA